MPAPVRFRPRPLPHPARGRRDRLRRRDALRRRPAPRPLGGPRHRRPHRGDRGLDRRALLLDRRAPRDVLRRPRAGGAGRGRMSASGIVLRIAVLIAAVLIAARITAEFRESLDFVVMPHNEIAVHRSIMLATAAFIVLLAIPFVPGAEIGLTMLAVFGPPIAPLVYAA